MNITERIVIVAIGAGCLVACVGLLKGWSIEEMITPLASFGLGTLFPSLLEKETILDNK